MELSELADWEPIFGNEWRASSNDINPVYPGLVVSLDAPKIADVIRIVAADLGERDEKNWLIVGELKDGRFFSITAGCDYTGWGCRDWGTVSIALSEEDIIRYGLSTESRHRLGIPLIDDPQMPSIRI
jgi:hypothetical protein